MNLRLEQLEASDLTALRGLASKALPELSYLDAKGWKTQLFDDPDFEPGYLLKALDGRNLLGVGLGVARRVDGAKAGWIKLLAVAPRARRRGVGRALLGELERRFQKRDCAESRLGACPPPYVNGGVPMLDTAAHCFLLARGYQRSGTVIDMVSDLRKLRPPDSAELRALKGLGGRKAGPKDVPVLKAMVRTAFPHWAWEADAALARGVVWVAGMDGAVTAFACADGTHPGWFGPMGTLEAERGKGLGRLLLIQCLHHMKKRGCKSARIPWVGPVPFYRRHAGAVLGPLYWTFAKRL